MSEATNTSEQVKEAQESLDRVIETLRMMEVAARPRDTVDDLMGAFGMKK